MSMAAATMDTLAARLASYVGRHVINQTSLSGKFDVDLEFMTVTAAPAPLSPSGTGDQPAGDELSIFTAMQEQLGLKLDSQRGPVDVLVIDHAEHPTEN